ncbi:MAG: hypothetical protein AB9903_32590 [Vulcanimicrobiota bacterium]
MIESNFRENLFGMLALQPNDGSTPDQIEDDNAEDGDIAFDYTHDLGIPYMESGTFETRSTGSVEGVYSIKPSQETAERCTQYAVSDRVDLSAGAFQLLLCA